MLNTIMAIYPPLKPRRGGGWRLKPAVTEKNFYFLDFRFLAVFAAALKAFAVGAPLVPGLRIFSFDPALMRFLLA